MSKKEIKFESFFGFALTSAKAGEIGAVGFQFNVTGPSKPQHSDIMVLNCLEDLVYPEIMRRVKEGKVKLPFKLNKAHILLFSDNTKNDVLLNDEVRFQLLMRLKKGKSFKKKDPIRESDVDEVIKIYPDKRNDPNAAHIMMVKIKNQWYFAADLVYDKEKMRKKFDTAKNFLESAKSNLDKELWSPFIDNLFSATELAAQSVLLLRHYGKYSLKQSHEDTRKYFTAYWQNKNTAIKFVQHYDSLSELRKKARYSQGLHGRRFTLKKEKAKELLGITSDMMEHCTIILENVK